MKIISKYKDYYDYLIAAYGEDPKLILDRRSSEPAYLVNNYKFILYIADYIIEGIVKNNNFYYGKKLEQFKIKEKEKYRIWLSKHKKRDYNKSTLIKVDEESFWIYLEPIKDKEYINKKHNCPILIDTPYGLKKYPKLENYKLASFISAKTIYKWLSEWLSNQITEKEQDIKILSDTLKIQNKGFDLKTSFRPKIKKKI